MSENERLGIIAKWAKNNPIIVGIIILGSIVIYLGSFTDSLDKIITFRNKYLSEKKQAVIASDSDKKKIKKSDSNIVQKKSKKTLPPNVNPSSQKVNIDNKVNTIKIVPTKYSLAHPQLPKQAKAGDSKKIKNIIRITPKNQKKKIEVPNNNKRNIKQYKTPKINYSEIRPIVNAAVMALAGETTSNRVDSIQALLPSLPANLSGREIAKLLGSETTSHRESILELLATKVKHQSLNPTEIPLILGNETTSNRIRCIEIIAPYIKQPISGHVAAEILGGETYSDRVRALQPIATKIRKPLKEKEVNEILNGTSTSDRTDAIKLLFRN